MESPAPSDGLPLMRDLPPTGRNYADAHDDEENGDDFAVVGHPTDDGPDNCIASYPVIAADDRRSASAGDTEIVMRTTNECSREQISNNRARKTTTNWVGVTAVLHRNRYCYRANSSERMVAFPVGLSMNWCGASV